MLIRLSVAFSLLSFLTTCSLANAATIFVSVSGQFGAAIPSDPYAAPGASWFLGFNVDDHPAVTNADTLGFDARLSNLTYRLNGSAVSLPASALRFFNIANLGLFTIFFGPEAGFFSDGTAVPEFSFEGPQTFAGTTAVPVLSLGQFPVSSWEYSDSLVFDSHPSGGITIGIATAPEPATFWLLAVPVLFFAYRFRSPAQAQRRF